MKQNRFQLAVVVAIAISMAGVAHAEIQSAELGVNGLSCPFCAFGIEKKLLDVDGVRDVEVFLDEGRIALTFHPGADATVDDLEDAVAKAGFELATLSLEVRGDLLEESGGRLVSHTGMTFRLLEMRAGGTGPVSAETLRRLRETEAPGRGTVVVEGAVTERGEAEPSLVVQATGSAEARKK